MACAGPSALSPGRKLLIAHNGLGCELYDTLTGERQGQLAMPRVEQIKAASFRADGQEIAFLCFGTSGFTVVRAEVQANGKSSELRGVPMADQLEWSGKDFLLVGQALFDAKLQAPIWNYSLAGTGRHGTGSPDGRHWFAVGRAPNEPAVLAAQTLPDAAARRLLEQIADGSVQKVLAPGSKVAIRLEGATPALDGEGWRKRVLDTLNTRLGNMKLQVAQGQADVTLSIQVDPEHDTGESINFRHIGPGAMGKVTKVVVKDINCHVSLADAQGKVFWEQKMPFKMSTWQHMLRGDDPEAILRKSMWDAAALYAGNAFLPTYVVRTSDGVKILPQNTALTADH